MISAEIILYVSDQETSKYFYATLLAIQPVLDVPGMTEFQLSNKLKLGLMPENGIAKIIHPPLPHPADANGVPRCELYLVVDDAVKYIKRGIDAGATNISTLTMRNWGDKAGYIADPDGHVIAFAEKNAEHKG